MHRKPIAEDSRAPRPPAYGAPVPVPVPLPIEVIARKLVAATVPTVRAKKNTPDDVLQLAVAITAQRDRDVLARTLVGALNGLVHSDRIIMYRILPSERGDEAILAAEICTHPGCGANPAEETKAVPVTAICSCSGCVASPPQVNILISSRADLNSVFSSGRESVRPLAGKTFLSVYPIFGQHGVSGFIELVAAAYSGTESNSIAALIKVYGNYVTLLDESETDTLTGLQNRRTFDANIERIIAEHTPPEYAPVGTAIRRAKRHIEGPAVPHWLAIIDIDHFKRINDQFGHLYGDEVLILLARNMKRLFRQRDKLFRFGGEEFVIVLDRTVEASAKIVLDRFRETIEQTHFPQVGKVTVSIGFVRMDKIDVSSAIIGRADQALYYAKQNGRNRVCFYENLVAKGILLPEYYSDSVQFF